MYIILVYDIQMDKSGAKIRKKVFDISKKYLTRIQNSVFEGQINESELFVLEKTIKKQIRSVDSLIIFKSKYDRPYVKAIYGITTDPTDNFL